MTTLIKNGLLINEGHSFRGSLWFEGDTITRIQEGDPVSVPAGVRVFDAKGLLVLPGVIDDQVHFREPGLTAKGDIFTESRAAVAGGITSFMEMPNTKPPTLTQEALEYKYLRAAEVSHCNYSFYMGVSNDNAEEVLKTNSAMVCGIKIFLGASTGNLLVDNQETLEQIFREARLPIAVHCEHEPTIQANLSRFRAQFPEGIRPGHHPDIRSSEACILSTTFARNLAQKHKTRLHILHLSTEEEAGMMEITQPLREKSITSEVCVHHLWFSRSDYQRLGNRIKWNPAIKDLRDKEALFDAVLTDRIDVIATDHAPHTLSEKALPYLECPSGGPLVQHALPAMLEFWKMGRIGIEKIVEKMCHNPAKIFGIKNRGFLREGYKADITLINPSNPWEVEPSNILYKCGWSPFEGQIFQTRVETTFVNGQPVFHQGMFMNPGSGQRLLFEGRQ